MLNSAEQAWNKFWRFGIFIFMTKWNFMLSWVEHEKKSYNLEARFCCPLKETVVYNVSEEEMPWSDCVGSQYDLNIGFTYACKQLFAWHGPNESSCIFEWSLLLFFRYIYAQIFITQRSCWLCLSRIWWRLGPAYGQTGLMQAMPWNVVNHWSINKVREKSRERHNHKPQPFPDTKRKRKQTKPNKPKSNKRTKSIKLSSLFPRRGNRNAKRTNVPVDILKYMLLFFWVNKRWCFMWIADDSHKMSLLCQKNNKIVECPLVEFRLTLQE